MLSDLKKIIRFGENLSKICYKRSWESEASFEIDFKIDEERIKLSQQTYIHDILQCFGMKKSNWSLLAELGPYYFGYIYLLFSFVIARVFLLCHALYFLMCIYIIFF